MAQGSSIEWTEATWNPVTGCTKISAGCKHCYAERMAKRLKAMGVPQYRNGFKLTLQPQSLELPLKWRQPKRIFVNSMSDLFHEDVPFEFIEKVFDVMNRCPQHTFQILTKRPEIAAEFAPQFKWTPNIWMGTSVEDERVLWRIKHLREIRAKVRFLSLEPLIGPMPNLPLRGIHWVIVGGESGPKTKLYSIPTGYVIFAASALSKMFLSFLSNGEAPGNFNRPNAGRARVERNAINERKIP